METLNLDKALEETQEGNQTTEVATETTQETTQTQEGQQDTTDKTDDKTEETKDDFDGLSEITELNNQFVTLGDGRRMKVSDLVDGNMRQEDYTQKTMDLAESRRQLDLAQSSTPAPTKEEKKAAIDLTEQNATIAAALSEMDENDPLAIVMKGLVSQNNHVIDFINNQAKSTQEATEQASTEDNIANAQKLINDSLDKEAKNYNLPTIKGSDGEETNMRELFNQLVLADLQATNENLTLAQFNYRVSQIGKKAYKRLRSVISAASVKKVTDTTGNGETPSQEKETKVVNPSEETNQTEKNKGLSLHDRISNAMDTIANKK